MGRDGLNRMDVDTRWPTHRKTRKLARLYPEHWPAYWTAYMALLGEAWWSKDRTVTLEDAFPAAMPCSLEDAQAALVAAGFLDDAGLIPESSWQEWFGPAWERIIAASERGRNAAMQRWHSDSNADALPEQSNGYTPRQPTTPANHAKPANDEIRGSIGPENARGTTRHGLQRAIGGDR